MISRTLPALMAVGLLAGCGEDGADRRHPNVLLISLDSTRQDLISCYGRVPKHAPSRATTPNIDRLAQEGVRFENAYSTSSWTLPSHMSLLTGQPDLVHAVEYESLRVHADRPLLAEVLSEAGYRTAGFFSGPYLAPTYGFGRGFDRYQPCYGSELVAAVEAQAAIEAQLRQGTNDQARLSELMARMSEAGARVEQLSHIDVSSSNVTDAVLEELKAARGDARPWFVFAHYFDPHYDYVPPAPHDERFDSEYAGAFDGRDFYQSPAVSVQQPQPNRPHHRVRTIEDRDLEHILALYEGELEWTDLQVGRILDDLRLHGDLDDTLVILTSDHGDEFFEHGNIGHRRTLFEEVMRVPLVMRFPSRLSAGQTASGVASIMDVYATVLDFADVDLPDGVMSESLAPMARGERKASRGRALGRLVDPRVVSTENGPGQFVRIQESYVRWPIKIRRMRQWVDPTPMTPPNVRNAMLAKADQDRARDTQLVWIDLEQSPQERLEDYSADFSHPEAKAALDEFQRVYRSMIKARKQPMIAEGASQNMLTGLGYAGSDSASVEDLMLERFLLTPPGTN